MEIIKSSSSRSWKIQNVETSCVGVEAYERLVGEVLRRGKGSRGGLRIIYLHVPEVSRFLLLDVYSKDEADDLEDGERKLLAALAAEYKDTAIGQARKEESR